jgi:DNA-binding GntR family transcriptional regulator
MAHATDDAYAALRERILSGHIGSGERLGEMELSQQLGVSRTPIREALRRLSADGLVELSPNRGARVTEWSVDDLNEIYRLRALLEGYGASLAAHRIESATIATLSTLCDEMEHCARRGGSRDLDRLANINSQFHATILDTVGSNRLVGLLATVVQVPLVLRAFHQYSPEQLTRSMSQHRDLVAALSVRDGDWAEMVMRAHVLAARNALLGADSGPQEIEATGS